MVSQHSDESFCGARMHGRDIRDRAGGLAGGDCRGNEVDDLSGMRADCYASQKALRFGVDVAFNCHVVALDGRKIVVSKQCTAPENAFDLHSFLFGLLLSPAYACDGWLGMEKPGEPPFVEPSWSSKDVLYGNVRLSGGNAVK